MPPRRERLPELHPSAPCVGVCPMDIYYRDVYFQIVSGRGEGQRPQARVYTAVPVTHSHVHAHTPPPSLLPVLRTRDPLLFCWPWIQPVNPARSPGAWTRRGSAPLTHDEKKQQRQRPPSPQEPHSSRAHGFPQLLASSHALCPTAPSSQQ